MTGLWNLILWLKSLVNVEEEPIEQELSGSFSEDMVNPALERAESSSDFVLEVLRWPLSILLLLVLFFVLVFAYRRFSARHEADDDGYEQWINSSKNKTIARK